MAAELSGTDDIGVSHGRAGSPARIVSLVPSITELLFDLGLGGQVVGRTSYCVHPADQLASVPSIGGTKKIRMDRLLALKPSHVLVNVDENSKAVSDRIAAHGIQVIVTHPLDPTDNRRLFRLIGGLFDRDGEAARLSARFDAAYAAAHAALAEQRPRSALYLIWKGPWMTVSRDTYIANMLALANWGCAGYRDELRYPETRLDHDALQAVDLVLFATEPYRFTQGDVDDFNAAREGNAPEARLIDGEMILVRQPGNRGARLSARVRVPRSGGRVKVTKWAAHWRWLRERNS